MFFASLSNEIIKKTNIIFDTGCSLDEMQGFECKHNIRIYRFQQCDGVVLPGSIGSHLALLM